MYMALMYYSIKSPDVVKLEYRMWI